MTVVLNNRLHQIKSNIINTCALIYLLQNKTIINTSLNKFCFFRAIKKFGQSNLSENENVRIFLLWLMLE